YAQKLGEVDMAYGLKYTQYISKGNTTLRINVYAKDWTGATYGMAHITGASLQLIGGQSSITAPIIKTSFSWSMIDAWDQGTTMADGTACVNAAGEKCGRWEEFYTNDATKFRVEILNGSTVIWRGYVTPDSWKEDMMFHGPVTITARDMLGAMQDAEFDLTGRVTVLQVIQGALAACECPMSLLYTASHFLAHSNGISILEHHFAASTFSGRSWYQALEETLDSLGLVLRYNGADRIVLTSLRYISADTLQGTHGIYFANRSGLRQLDPALKSITEVFEVDLNGFEAEDPDASRFTAAGTTMTQRQNWPSGGMQPRDVAISKYNLTAPLTGGWYGDLGIPRPGSVSAGVPDRSIYFPTDIITDGVSASYTDPRLTAPFRMTIGQDGGMLEYKPSVGNGVILATPNWWKLNVKSIIIQVVCSVSGAAYYLGEGGGWSQVPGNITIEPGASIEVPACSNGENYFVSILKIETASEVVPGTGSTFRAIALRLRFDPPATSTTPTEFKTTTNYDQENNVTITRSPKVGSASIDMSAAFAENVLGHGDVIVTDEWNWPGESSFYPLAVMIQAQLLCFNAAAATVFSGSLIDKQSSIALPGFAFSHSGRVVVPVSAVYGFSDGMASQSIAREVYSWEDVWGDSFAPEYTRTQGAGKGSTSATGTPGSSVTPGGGGTGGGVTMTEVQQWVGEQDYAPKQWVQNRGYLTANDIDEDFIATALGYTPLGPTDLNGYATQTWVNQQGFMTGIEASDIETALDYMPIGADYLTQNGYATQTWVGQQGYATQTWVYQRGYLTANDIDEDFIATALGYTPLGPTDLNGYATQTWVQQRGYITGITSTDIDTALGYTPLAPSALNGYYHTGNANRTDTDWACRMLTVALDFDIGTSSDVRLKEDIRDIPGAHAVDVIRKLRAVDYDWNARAIELDGRKALRTHDVGFIAQEVGVLIPEAVSSDYAGDFYRLDKTKIIPFLVAAVQQLLREVDTLRKGEK
ncbi:MAG: tail fiber domain-containing protein, partial [Bacteroidales bacterium]|nr:tail fiber domain-containing protein [Bacteroidales bacterium]